MAIIASSQFQEDILEQYLRLQKVQVQKSIPAQVFLNHFQAICTHISNDADSQALNKIKYFRTKIFSNPGCDYGRIRKVLWNSWSSEHALHLTGKQDNSDYYKYALHWSFPQAYYSCYLNMHAFCLAIGDERQSHLELIRGYGERLMMKKYPSCISFYADGNMNDFKVYNLPLASSKSAISGIKNNMDAQSQIATFLKSTRKNSSEYHRDKRQKSATPIVNNSGNICKSFKSEHWQKITDKLGPTTLFNILYRLRIKANYNDIETFMNAEIDFKAFHNCLMDIVGYLNFVHEAYLAKAIGYKKFKVMVDEFPAHLSDSFIKKRFEEKIIPSIQNAA